MKVSVIIPTLNEAENLPLLLERLQEGGAEALTEIIVVDGGSSDATCTLAKDGGALVLKSRKKGRAPQMNYGARQAQGDILYFVHGDTLPPRSYLENIKAALAEDFPVGCFRYQFDSPRWLLKINAYFTRFDRIWCRGGDQSLYIRREVFEALQGFREDYQIMEDFEFILRVRKEHKFKIIPENMIVSARKYHTNSYLRVQIANFVVFNMFRWGYSQESMVKMYKRLLDYR